MKIELCKNLNSLNKQSNFFEFTINTQKSLSSSYTPGGDVDIALHCMTLVMNMTKSEVNILSVLTSHHEIQFRKLFAVLNIHNPLNTHQSRLSWIYF